MAMTNIPLVLRRAYLAMHRHTDACLKRFGITADQLVILVVLTEGDGITQQELACRASSDPNTIRAMLLLLEKRGLVTRKEHPVDRRSHQVHLTPRGKAFFKRLPSATAPVRKQILEALLPAEVAALAEYLGRLAVKLESSKPRRGH
jgi:DNA-binding MarR family transcriptional regulator